MLVPEPDRVADRRGDGVAVPDVQRQAGPARPDTEVTAQVASQATRAGEKLDGLADDGLDQRFVRQGGSCGRI